MRPRDFQRSAVYRWEESLGRRGDREALPDLAEVRALVDRVLAEHGLNWAPFEEDLRGRSFRAFGGQLVYWSHGSRGGDPEHGRGKARYMLPDANGRPEFQELRVTADLQLVLHETAHLLLDQTDGVRGSSAHGARFVRALCELLARYTVSWSWPDALDYLLGSAGEAGLAVHPEPVLAPLWAPAGSRLLPGERARSSCEGRPTDVMARLLAEMPEASFSEIVAAGVAAGVTRNTARGLVAQARARKS